jgi:hypothetical protein
LPARGLCLNLIRHIVQLQEVHEAQAHAVADGLQVARKFGTFISLLKEYAKEEDIKEN